MIPRYYRTVNDGVVRTHLEGIGDATALCGLDVAGDDNIHDKEPVELPDGPHRVTCDQCQQIMELVAAHRKWPTTATQPKEDA